MGISKRVIGDLKNTDLITENTFFIGVYPGLDQAQMDYVCAVFERFMNGERTA
jgi:CDP-6-deoxy-D-xylo-4-hexulose-3-dehydrase